jgi:isopenicillin N synthase-like dioxygenase
VTETFELPEAPRGGDDDIRLGRALVKAWRTDGIAQVVMDPAQEKAARRAEASSRRFFAQSAGFKAAYVSDLTYAGYAASGEQVTAAAADHAEIFTVCQDIAPDDPRVREQWPCHGPVPWPEAEYRRAVLGLTDRFGELGDRLLRLAALGLGLDDADTFARLTWGGWHHMRAMRFPPLSARAQRGAGSRTDLGVLALALQDGPGGLCVRPPREGERRARGWLPDEGTDGMYELEAPWTRVEPDPGMLAAFPGDVMEFVTGGTLPATPYKAVLGAREHFAMVYSHAPNFQTCVRPLADRPDGDYGLHYGTHFTDAYLRAYPQRAPTRRILDEDRMFVLADLRRQATRSASRV